MRILFVLLSFRFQFSSVIWEIFLSLILEAFSFFIGILINARRILPLLVDFCGIFLKEDRIGKKLN